MGTTSVEVKPQLSMRALLASIDQQNAAAENGLYGYRECGRHEIITAHVNRIMHDLTQQFGPERACQIFIERMDTN